jgi:hypothetical protein
MHIMSRLVKSQAKEYLVRTLPVTCSLLLPACSPLIWSDTLLNPTYKCWIQHSPVSCVCAAAIGVMATVSGVELWWHSAVEQHDFLGITAAVAAGAVLFAVLDPLLPKHEDYHHVDKPPAAVAAAAEVQGTGLQVRPAVI